MSLNKLATSTFGTNPDEKVAAVDVYDVKGSKIVNSISQLPDEDANGNPIELAGPPRQQDLPPLVLDGQFGKEIVTDPKAVEQRVSGGDTALQVLFRDLSSAIKNKAFVGGGNINSVIGVLAGSAAKIIPGGIVDARTITSVLGKVTNGGYNLTFNDKGGTASLITTLTSAGSSLGLPKVFSTLAGAYTDKSVLLNSAQQLAPGVIKGGDLGTLSDMFSTSIGKDLVKMTPGIIPGSIGNFKLPTDTKSINLASLYDTYKSSFGTVNPTWDKVIRAGAPVLNGVLASSSESWKSLIKAKAMSQTHAIPAGSGGAGPVLPSHSENEKFLLLMEKYRVTTVADELNNSMPTVPLSIDCRKEDYDLYAGTTLT